MEKCKRFLFFLTRATTLFRASICCLFFWLRKCLLMYFIKGAISILCHANFWSRNFEPLTYLIKFLTVHQYIIVGIRHDVSVYQRYSVILRFINRYPSRHIYIYDLYISNIIYPNHHLSFIKMNICRFKWSLVEKLEASFKKGNTLSWFV